MLNDPYAPLFPPLEQIRSVSLEIAIAVGQEGQISGGAQQLLQELLCCIDVKMWKPAYPVLRYIPRE